MAGSQLAADLFPGDCDEVPLVMSARGEANPFRKQYGACASACGAIAEDPMLGVRIFWCQFCRRKFCWNCLKAHKD